MDLIDVCVRDRVATLLLNRPAKRNAVNHAMWQRITAVCNELAEDRQVRVLLVRGAGDHFCAGADIADLGSVDPAEFAIANQAADRALAQFPKPSIALIQGSCVGGGCQIATACDLRLADHQARLGITPAKLGLLYPAGSTERLTRLVGPSATKHLLFSAELIDTQRALRIGLVDEVLADASQAQQRSMELAQLMADQRSLLTQMASKAMVDAATRGAIPNALTEYWDQQATASSDRQEGIAAFLERRTPRFDWSTPTND